MPRQNSPLRVLAELLHGYAKPVIAVERLAPASTYDLDYRTALIVVSFQMNAVPNEAGNRRIRTAELKLMQFVAQRPWLLPVIRQWSQSTRNHQESLLVPQHLRRGYLADTMYDDVMDYLVAQGMFLRGPAHILEGARVLSQPIYDAVVEHALFTSEREVLTQLGDLKVTNNMLEGS